MPYLPDLAVRLNQLSEANLGLIVAGRLHGRSSFVLPPIATKGPYKIEDPSQIFLKLHQRNAGGLPLLGVATAMLIDRWQVQPIEQLVRNPEPMGEALYLVAQVGAPEAVPSVAKVAGNEQMSKAVLGTGEDLQGRALRSLAGLLVEVSKEDQLQHRYLFKAALNRRAHVPIGLMTLAGFWPSERKTFVKQALSYGDPQLTRLIRLVDDLTPMFSVSNGEE